MSRFTQTLHIERDPETSHVRLSVATSEYRVDEIMIPEEDFRKVARAMWERNAYYEGSETLRVKYKEDTQWFSLSVQTANHVRCVYRLSEREVEPVLGQYLAEVGGL